MAVICPAVLAASPDEYHQQMAKIAHFAERIQIDLTDGKFAKQPTLRPSEAWWPVGVKADFHLMYQQPDGAVRTILEHQPNMIIIHAEADGQFGALAKLCRHHGVKIGLALLPKTPPQSIHSALDELDHVLIFSGKLGEYGGHADLDLLNKVQYLKQHKPELEIGWDGGVNERNISQLAFGGVEVFDVGGYLQTADNPEKAYHGLARIAEETGTT